ncbi:hypothetical protein [Marmoricola sp. RAF53]|uniref:hypothetical protein n=1 Tax=Marmoricola sp. RAF53 TaxID=3233059 RepID=UPI003F9AEB02
MSTIEERLARDIEAVTRGVVVTEHDLRDAREELDERIENKQRRDRRRILAVAVAAAVVIPVVGYAVARSLDDQTSAPPPAKTPEKSLDDQFLTGTAPTAEVLNGFWRVDNGGTVMLFDPNGGVRFDDGGTLYADPAGVGRYQVDGDLITIDVSAGRGGCAGQTIALRASLAEPGVLRTVLTEPGTGRCAPNQGMADLADMPAPVSVDWGALEQILPANSGQFIDVRYSDEPGGDWQPAKAGALPGDWVAEGQPEGGGFVLELTDNGSYSVADSTGDPVDRGSWSLTGGDLVLTTTGGSACSPGDRLVLGGLETVEGTGSRIMRGKVGQNACDAPWSQDAWVLIPNNGN